MSTCSWAMIRWRRRSLPPRSENGPNRRELGRDVADHVDHGAHQQRPGPQAHPSSDEEPDHGERHGQQGGPRVREHHGGEREEDQEPPEAATRPEPERDQAEHGDHVATGVRVAEVAGQPARVVVGSEPGDAHRDAGAQSDGEPSRGGRDVDATAGQQGGEHQVEEHVQEPPAGGQVVEVRREREHREHGDQPTREPERDALAAGGHPVGREQADNQWRDLVDGEPDARQHEHREAHREEGDEVDRLGLALPSRVVDADVPDDRRAAHLARGSFGRASGAHRPTSA